MLKTSRGRRWSIVGPLTAIVTLVSAVQAADAKRPNVVLIFTDDK